MDKDKNNIMSIPGRIRAIRKALSLTQKEMAQRLKISGPTISEFETGKLLPNFYYIYHIKREFNVALDYLLFGEGDMFAGAAGELGKRLEKWIKNSEDAACMLDYFEKSAVVRYFLLSQFKAKMLTDGAVIEKEIWNITGSEDTASN